MSTKSNISAKFVLILISVTIILVVGFAWTRPWYDEGNRPIRVAYLPIYVDLPLFVAEKEGYFKLRGVEVQLIPFQSSPDMSAALASGNVDAVASIATSSALVLESRDADRFRIFLVDAENPDNYLSSLLIASSSKINNVSDLRGAKIGSFPGPTAKLFGPLALENLGLVAGDYDIVELPIGSHISALEAGIIDAVITYEPTATQAVMKYKSRKLVPALVESHVINPWQAGVWIISKDYAQKYPEKAKSFVLAIYDAIEIIRRNPKQAKKALSFYTKIDIDIATKTPDIPFTKIHEVDLITLQRHADLLKENKIISKSIAIHKLLLKLPDDD